MKRDVIYFRRAPGAQQSQSCRSDKLRYVFERHTQLLIKFCLFLLYL